MTDEEIDTILQRASGSAPRVDPALLKRIAAQMNSSLRPVRPLLARWVLSSGLALSCAALAVAVGAMTGFSGVEKLTLWKSVMILSTLGILLWVAAKSLVNHVIPGSRHPLSALAILIGVTAALLGVFALAFQDYRLDHFVSDGLPCLRTGLLVAVPAAALIGLLLRRGFAVNALTAALAAGVLAGLCGVTMLELHCPNFLALHVLVWHTAVVPVSAAAGVLVARALRRR